MNMQRSWLIALVLTTGCSRGNDAESEAELRRRYPNHVPEGEPTATLPRHVQAPSGQFTLFADFERAKVIGEPGKPPRSMEVTLYLVNRTGKAIPLGHYGDFLFTMLEHEASPGTWEGAEIYKMHWCATPSYSPPLLRNDTYMSRKCFYPAAGLRAPIRYRLHLQPVRAVSNIGIGFVDMNQVKEAKKGIFRSWEESRSTEKTTEGER